MPTLYDRFGLVDKCPLHLWAPDISEEVHLLGVKSSSVARAVFVAVFRTNDLAVHDQPLVLGLSGPPASNISR